MGMHQGDADFEVSERVQDSARITLGSALWIALAAILPVYRLVMTNVSALFPYVVLALIVLCVLLGRVAYPVFPRLWLGALVVVPMAAVIAGTTTSIIASAIVGVKIAILIGLGPFVIRYFVLQDRNFVRRALTGFVAVQTVSAAAGLVQVTGVTILGRAANSGRANGLAVHPNVLGIMCALTLLICIWALPRYRGGKRLLLVAVTAVNAAALFATGSLSSLLAAAIGAVVLLVCMRITVRAVLLLIGAATLAFVGLSVFGYDTTVLTGSVEERVDVVTGVSDGVASLNVRERTYDYAWQSISADPITGVGMDGVNEATFDSTTVVHNYILRGWYQGGFLLFATLAAFTIAMLVLVFRSIRDAENSVAAGTITTMLTFAATSAFYDQQQYWLPILLAVAVMPPKKKPQKKPKRTSESAARVRSQREIGPLPTPKTLVPARETAGHETPGHRTEESNA